MLIQKCQECNKKIKNHTLMTFTKKKFCEECIHKHILKSAKNYRNKLKNRNIKYRTAVDSIGE